MHIRKRYLLAFLVLIGVVVWIWHLKVVKTEDERVFNFNLQQLRSVTKLVIWEQDFSLNDIEAQERTYFNWLTTKESVSTTVNGKMGFHINLGDSVHTIIQRNKDTVIIKAPLQVTYVSLDLTTLKQVKEASIDPSIHVDKDEVIKHLDQIALLRYLPQVTAAIKAHSLNMQQKHLSHFIGKPVKIVLTSMPRANDWKK